MYTFGLVCLLLVFAATLWGGLIAGPQRLVPFLIFVQTMILPAGIVLQVSGLPDIDKVTAITLPALLLMFVTPRERWARYRAAWPDAFLYLLVVWAFFSVLLNNGPYQALSRLLLLIATLIVPYVAGRLYLCTSEDLHAFVKAVVPLVVLYAVGMALEARLQPFFSEVLFGVWAPAHERLGLFRPVMLASGSLELGHYMVLAVIVLAGAWRGWRGLDQPIPRALPIGALAAGLAACLSVSRGPVIGLLLALVTPRVLRETRWLGTVLGVGGLVFFLWMLGPTVTGAEIAAFFGGEAAMTDGTYSQTVGYRFLQIDAFEPLVNSRPWLGWGESFERSGDIVIVDGILLIYALLYGYPGAVLLMAFWTSVAFYIGRAAYRGNSPYAHIGQLLAPVIGWLAFSAWGDSFLREPHLLIMSAVVGVMVAERRLARPLMQPLRRMVFVSG
ncbi:MAG TPA: hypothetical protein VK081_09950 [Planctomycetota bacterium]|nr:hypothetical protein [Planctomycetota bacterium]